MSENTYKKCDKAGWCRAMDERLQEGNARAKGLAPLVLLNMNTGKSREAGVVYKKSAGDRGLLLNNCPWCGEPINFVKEKQ